MRRILQTKITRVLCRRRSEGSIPRAVKFRDLLTADHKILNEVGELFRNNHRYAVVVQDLATQWIQSYPCKTKTSQETEKSLRKLLEPSQKPKVFIPTIRWNLANPVKNYHGTIELPRLTDQKINGIAERAARRVKAGTSAVLLQSGLDENWWSDSMECCCCHRNVQDLLADGKTPYERRFGESSFHSAHKWHVSQPPRETKSENPSIRKEGITRNFHGICLDHGANLDRRHSDR